MNASLPPFVIRHAERAEYLGPYGWTWMRSMALNFAVEDEARTYLATARTAAPELIGSGAHAVLNLPFIPD